MTGYRRLPTFAATRRSGCCFLEDALWELTTHLEKRGGIRRKRPRDLDPLVLDLPTILVGIELAIRC